jgi:diguanylate cyclase (GGDEF)-like protein
LRQPRDKVVGQNRLPRLQGQLEHIGPLGFSDPAMEREYLGWVRGESSLIRQVMMAVPLLAMLLAPLYRNLIHHPNADAIFWLRLIEWGVVIPLCTLSIGVLRKYPHSRLGTQLMLIASIAVFWAVAMIRWVTTTDIPSMSPEIVMVVPLTLAAVARLRLQLILPVAVLCPALFLVAEYLLPGHPHFAATVLGTLLFCALTVITAIATDRLLRRAWLSRAIVELTAMSDAVTGLPNRQWFNRDYQTLFSQSRRNREPLAVFLIDLDHFKKLNDHHGHAAGDEALARIGELLRRFSRRPMDLSGRYGGEEFVLVLHNPTFNGAQRIVRDLLTELEQLGIENSGAPLGRVTASAGIYMAVPTAEDRPEDFLRLADGALYAAKQAGRNRFCMARPEDAVAAPLD